MTKEQIKRFKQENPELNIIHIVSAVYKDIPDSMESLIFYKDNLGVNAVQRELFDDNDEPLNITYEEKEKAFKSEIDIENKYTRDYIFENKRQSQEEKELLKKQMASRCITLYNNLEKIGFVQALDLEDTEEQEFINQRRDLEIEEFISKKCEDNLNSIAIYQDFLNKFEIDEEELDKFFENDKVNLKYETIKSYF